MASHTEVEKRFIAYLLEKGFSEAAIIYDPEFKSSDGVLRARPDLLIAEPDTRNPLAIVEIKSELRTDKRIAIRAQVETYANLFPDVPTYLVTDGPSPILLSFYRFNRETKELDAIAPEVFPSSFPAMLAERITVKQAALGAVREERKETSRVLHWLCFALAVFAVLLAAADFICKQAYGIELLTPARLGLIGAAFGLALVPFVQKFKGLGFEYERLTLAAKAQERNT